MKRNSPKVSIVLPTYNRAKYLRYSVESCLHQTYSNIELIVVDDCSTDGTPEVLQSCADRRIKVIRHEKNMNLPRSLNTGFAAATGEYLTWTSDDNLYYKEAIGKMLSFLAGNSSDFVYCDYYEFEDNNLFNRRIVTLPDTVSLEKGNHVGCCFMYSRRVKETVGEYDPAARLAEDYDYWIRASKMFSLRHLSEPLYFYRKHGESLYETKYLEVKTADFLVRFRNHIIDTDHAIGLFIDLVAQRRKGHYRLNKMVSAIMLSRRIRRVLRDLADGEVDFENAKARLYAMVTE